MVFSDVTGDTGILQRARKLARVDAVQWPTVNVVNSVNDRLDKIFNYGRSDRRFQLDDSNHTKLPIGTENLVVNQEYYSFLTDEQGNKITNITRVEIMDTTGIYHVLSPIDQRQINMALDEFNRTAGIPRWYDKVADNIIRLYPKPADSVTAGIKYYFQRTPSYFIATDTTKEPGVANELHRGFVVQAAYDAALTLGRDNLNALAVELQKEDAIMAEYFNSRNTDEIKFIEPVINSSR